MDALTVKGVIENELQKLVDDEIVPAETVKFPYLGEIPEFSPPPTEPEVEAEEEDEDEDDDDEDDEDSDEEAPKRRKKRGPRSTVAITKREGGSKDEGIQSDSRKRRGRPPRVDTPMEARIKNILKGIRKYKNETDQVMIYHFEKLPDKTVMPEYYQNIAQPIALEMIKVSVI